MNKQVIEREELQVQLRRFKEEYADTYDLQALGYFGSYARGDAKPDSDVDIVFDTGSPNLFAHARMQQDLEEFLGRPVHSFRLEGIDNPRFRARVEREAVYV